jgi:hypothetical protein
LVTTATKIKQLRFLYSALLRIGIEAANRSGYPKRNVKQFLGIISIGIFSRCYVCLDQLGVNEKRSGNVFDPKQYQRKDLVCDMDTAKNKWRSLRYHLRIANGKMTSLIPKPVK